MLEDYYRPMFKIEDWDEQAAEAMKLNDFIYIDRILNRHGADPNNIITDQGLMIHSAVLNDCHECVKLILDAGADPNYPYPGTAFLKDCKVGDRIKKIDYWTPLMMAVAKGNMRVIDALLESPNLRVTQGLPDDHLHLARSLVRKWSKSEAKFTLLKKLYARPEDRPILEEWVRGIALRHLSMEFALQRRDRKNVEFLLHNCIFEIDPEWLKFAILRSSAECLQILIEEYPFSIEDLELDLLIKPGIFEWEEKREIINLASQKSN
jgi:ankyrin repeat protein